MSTLASVPLHGGGGGGVGRVGQGETVPASRLRPIPGQFAALAPQAHEVQLIGVVAPADDVRCSVAVATAGAGRPVPSFLPEPTPAGYAFF